MRSMKRRCLRPGRCPEREFCEWDREPAPWLHSECRLITPSLHDERYSLATLSGHAWPESRFDAEYQREHQWPAISQNTSFQTIYKQNYCEGKVGPKPSPVEGLPPPAFPGHQPTMMDARYMFDYSAPTSTSRFSFMDPILQTMAIKPCFCHGPYIACPAVERPRRPPSPKVHFGAKTQIGY